MHLRPSACTLRRSILALAGLVLALAAPAPAAEKALWGPASLPDGSSAFGLYEELGIDTLQMSISWADVAPVRPAVPADPADRAYRWPADLTAAAADARAHGIGLSLLVTYAPPWANGGRGPTHGPGDPQDFADFLTAVARRYPAVRRWMIWGEPNRDDRFQPNMRNDPAGPRAYALLLDAAYGALKAQSADNKVIGGNTWTSGTVMPPDFLRLMRLPDGRRPRLDWFGHNPFPFRRPDLDENPIAGGFRDISDTDTLSREVRRAYGRPVPLWLSEYTIQSDHGSQVFETFVSRQLQATYLTLGYRIGDDLGPAVAGVGWLALLDEPPGATSANWGLLTHALERKPTFAAMARAPSERLRPAVRVAPAVARRTLRRQGIGVRVTPRAAGMTILELRDGGRVRARVRARAVASRTRTLRLRIAVGRGRFTITVRSTRGSSVKRALHVR